ncbi:hypothetical protein LTR49_027657, partial [Elasticomyces elasticus]
TRGLWETAFRNSRWHTRGWTLQELLAPTEVEFFSREGRSLGNKDDLGQLIERATGIPASALRGILLRTFSVEERMQWAAQRRTKKVEDKWYSMLGVFGVHMTLIYGEGADSAEKRLTDEIGKSYRVQLDRCRHERIAPTISESGSIISMRREKQLKSLEFEQMDSRRSTLKSAWSTTCQWLLKHPAYISWIDLEQLHQHHGLLWVQGKPDAGKSTLMKFAYAHDLKNGAQNEILISFFFNARGDELEKSTVGMYRSLLLQILTKASDLQHVLNEHQSSSGIHYQEPVWTIESLQELLTAAVKELKSRRLKCFIDALDECDQEQVQEMILFLEELGQYALEAGASVSICFASRHYPAIDIKQGGKLVVEDESGHGEDLVRYVHKHLGAGGGRDREEVKAQILQKANGVFMWVVLVVGILNKELLNGRMFAVKKRLKEIPSRLSDLFRDILSRDVADTNDLLLCLQWILFAKRPLRREEFYFAMVSGLDPEPENLSEWNSEMITIDRMSRFVLSSSKGLAELTKSKMATVQFIHESVKDYLVRDGGMYELWPELKDNVDSSSHDRLKYCCQSYLAINSSCGDFFNKALPMDAAKDLRQNIALKFPFLDYASQHILYHADEAARTISQHEFLQRLALQPLLKVTNLFEQYNIRRHTTDASLPYILAENNFARLIKTLHLNGKARNFRGERYHFPLFAALTNGHRDAVRALVQQDEDPDAEDVTTHLEFGKGLSFRKDHTPLLWAVEHKYEILAGRLIISPDVDLNSADHKGQTALSLAAGNGCERLVDLLAARVVDIDLKDKAGRTPLSYAIEQGHRPVAQTLLDRGANIEATSGSSWTALLWTAPNGKETMARLMLDRGAKIEAADNDGKTSLISAAQHGNKPVVQLLVDRGANVEAADSGSKTALVWAAICGQEITAQLLLDKGAEIEAADKDGKTALIWAAQNGKETLVKLLLERTAKTEAADKDGNTALISAAQHGHQPIVHLLLKGRAIIEAADSGGSTALIWAARNGKEPTVEVLLDREAKIEAADNDGKTSLVWAARNGYKPVVALLLNRGAAIEAVDSGGNTAFMWAAQSGRETTMQIGSSPMSYQLQLMRLEQQNRKRLVAMGKHSGVGDLNSCIAPELGTARESYENVMDLLLHRGAKIEAADNDGKTSLISAARHGDKSVMQLLLDRGANIEAADSGSKTALGWAAMCGEESAIQFLLDKGAEIEAADKDGKTSLMWAAQQGHKPAVKLLLDRGASIDAADCGDKTALTWAAQNRKESVLHKGALASYQLQLRILEQHQKRLLMARGEQSGVSMARGEQSGVEEFDNRTIRELTTAQEGHGNVMDLLLERGANVEAAENDSKASLVWLARDGEEASV